MPQYAATIVPPRISIARPSAPSRTRRRRCVGAGRWAWSRSVQVSLPAGHAFAASEAALPADLQLVRSGHAFTRCVRAVRQNIVQSSRPRTNRLPDSGASVLTSAGLASAHTGAVGG